MRRAANSAPFRSGDRVGVRLRRIDRMVRRAPSAPLDLKLQEKIATQLVQLDVSLHGGRLMRYETSARATSPWFLTARRSGPVRGRHLRTNGRVGHPPTPPQRRVRFRARPPISSISTRKPLTMGGRAHSAGSGSRAHSAVLGIRVRESESSPARRLLRPTRPWTTDESRPSAMGSHA